MDQTFFRGVSMLKRLAGAFTVSAVVLNPVIALALADPTPDAHWVAVDNDGLTDGNVRAVVAASDGSYYVAGAFNNVGRSYGNAVLASASTGLSESPFPDVDGDVYVTISDNVGGWYIGGTFNRVGALQRSGVAHILPDGTPDEDFAPVIGSWGGGTVVNALAMGEDDEILYVGGDMEGSGSTTFSGIPVTSLVALDAATGAVDGGFATPDLDNDVPTTLGRGNVYALAYDELTDTLYAGGSFDKVGLGTSRNNLVAFDGSTGATTSFNPNIDTNTTGIVYALVLDGAGDTLYTGGSFTEVGGAGADPNHLVALDTGTSATTSFDAGLNTDVYALALDEPNNLLYLGGELTIVDGEVRNHLAAVHWQTGSVNGGFDPNTNEAVFSIALTADGSTLYAVGPFTEVNVASGSGVTRDGIAAFDTTVDPGDDIAGFNQSMQMDPYFIALNDDDTSVLIGAYNGPSTGTIQYQADQTALDDFGGPGIIHILPDGTRDPDFLAFADDMIRALALDEDSGTLYAGGDFTTVNGNPTPSYRRSLAAFDATTGTETDFDPGANNVVRTLAISSDGGTLYAGGDFSAVNLTHGAPTRNHIAAFDTDAVDPTDNVTAFDPNTDGNVYALALSSDDGTLYAGGDFLFVNAVDSRQNLAAFDTDTVDPLDNVTPFDPDANGAVVALALSGDDGTLYAGGSFEEVNGNIGTVFRNYAAAFETTAGVATDFDPDADDSVQALAIGPDGIVYLGGQFDTVSGDDHEYIAAVDPDTGAPEVTFDSQLSGISDQVFALAHGGTGNGLLVGGVFNNSFNDPFPPGDEVPYVVVVGLAHYADSATPTPTPATPTPTPTPGGGGGSSGGGGSFIPGATPTPSGGPLPTVGDPANLARYGLREGDTVSARNTSDPDIYIVNEHGYKRLFLNPVIFNFYGHLGWSKVRSIVPTGRDVFPTSGLFRNCETNDPRVWAVEVTGEDTGWLHHVQISGAAAVSQDPEFFKKVFCINNNEFNWYPKSPVPYTSLSQVPVYTRR